MTRENTIELVLPEEATGKTAEIYEEISETRKGNLDDDLRLSKLWMTFGNDPDIMEAAWQHTDVMYNGGEISFELKSKISLVVASVMNCEGCRFFHESALVREGTDDEEIEHMKRLDFGGSAFSELEYTVLEFAEKAATQPNSITDEDLQALKDAGFNGKRLLEVLDCIAFHVYTATLQAMAGIVYEGMSREEWTSLDEADADTNIDARADTPTVELFKAEDCGRCAQVRKTLEDIADERGLTLRITDVEDDRERALERGVMSTPTVIVAGEVTLTGVPDRDELIDTIEAHG